MRHERHRISDQPGLQRSGAGLLLSAVRRWLNPALLAVTLLALPIGGALQFLHRGDAASWVWSTSALLLALMLTVEIVIQLRRREMGVDVIALLAIIGAVLLQQHLVSAVIALMLASGRTLENYTTHRAERELRKLVDRVPRFARRYRNNQLEQVPLDQVTPGDRLLLRAGEVVPVDGIVLDTDAVLDESALSGESLPVRRHAGETVLSGSVNAGAPFDLSASRAAAQSTYAGIVRMVEAARNSRAPFMRLADRYALALIPLTLILAGLAWLLSGDPVRALAVLVVATPCPLILAVPVAIVGGISRCARRGILVKDGATLEALAQAQILFFDKTGTLTTGQISVLEVEAAGLHSSAQLLQWAASLAQASAHTVAQALVQMAHRQGLTLESPRDVHEEAGAGLRGEVDGHVVIFGGYEYVAANTPTQDWADTLLRRMVYENLGASFIAIDGVMAGAIVFADRLRLESPRALRLLRRAGIRRIVMLTGDRTDTAQAMGLAAGVDEIHAELSPAEKLAAIERSSSAGITLMVGDGINDAPALAAANVGIAMGARGATAASEAAGVVLMSDRLDRIAEALLIARRSRQIAVQGVMVGMGLSLLAMLLAAAGFLAPLLGAVLQEGIDVLVLANALRALSAGRKQRRVALFAAEHNEEQLRDEHTALAPVLECVHSAAENIGNLGVDEAQQLLSKVVKLLDEQLIPHEQADERELYPDLADRLPGDDPLAAMSHTHREIFRLARLLMRINHDLAGTTFTVSIAEAQRTLVRLDAVLSLHFAQEDELYHNLDSH